ncbi:putative NAD(P)H quinone oxidoreductase, PIG3 family [Gracilibacillus orientalis]|uniref:Putative NAD(P)H quinone oxidoreductase, PIG3 family n=1 Tax=Gracilibacillus orientalis TaxID=334253 RepID=A0A1I4HP23_9BACI|nr:NAD(P)H-quinone oxidoreductase [Gracilibacillus orientalis]SFL43989.1 putative NAD(P)H quinone oxidoreductase, PIG3 family [Gracilibacillus orientalis]
MKGIIAKEPGGADQLIYTEMPEPELEAGDLLIEVHATAVNRTDILNREGKLGYVNNPIIGVEVAGVVTDANGHHAFKQGDRVMGLVNGGAYAEKAAMPAERAMKIPDSLSFAEAAAIPEVFLTAFQTLYWIGQLKENETILIHAGASGVGTAAIQLAKVMSDAQVIITAGSEEKLDYCRKLGADTVINYKEQDFAEEVLQATNKKGVDLILDFVGASYWKQNYKSIAVDGRWVLIGVLGGNTVNQVNLMDLMAKRIQLTGTLLTPRSDEYKAELSKDFINKTIDHFEQDTIKPVIDITFPITEAANAHKHMEANKNIGKIILTV